MPTNAYRSSGRPEVTYAIERVVDEAARRLGIDRIALRRMNLVGQEAMPYPNAVGALYDSGTYEANMDLAMEIADWDGFVARRRAAEARGKLLGLGLANYVESSIGAPRERSEITITSEGRVKVVIGTGPSGQGHETSFAQVVGAVLAVPVEAIDVVTGDTDIVSLGGGSHSGRSMRHSATLFAKAAPELIAKGRGWRPASSTGAPIRLPLPMAGSRHPRTTAASIFSNWRRRRRGSVKASLRSRPTTICTIRSFRMAAQSARLRSIPKPDWQRSPAIQLWTTSGAASTR
jgi:CO/xanthine dehydrogenase Mo-binding subunit